LFFSITDPQRYSTSEQVWTDGHVAFAAVHSLRRALEDIHDM
jgi:hypothetical protein